MESSIEIIKGNIKCRDTQINYLSGLIGEGETWLPSGIFIYGHSGTGKTLVLSSVLAQRDVLVCHNNCVEFYSSKFMFESILNQLSETVLEKTNNYQSYVSCDNLGDFVRHIKDINETKKRRMAIVLEHSERLRDLDANILPVLCRLQELAAGVNIVVIFTSTLPLDKFRGTTGFLEPIVLYFPQYTKDELVEILVNERPLEYTREFYKNYVNLVLSVFYIATKSLQELRHLVHLNIGKYCEPIKNGDASEDDIRVLWRNIEPTLKKALSTVYLREVSSEQFQRMQRITDSGVRETFNATPSNMAKMELPFYSKFLLIAAYLASYNPARSDKRFFVKHHGKQRKTQAMIKAKEKSSSQLVGPKPFHLDRMLAIFYSVIEETVAPSANIFSQISTLVTLRLLTQVGSDDQLDSPKYKCCISLGFIRNIARTVDFDILRYLYDFA